jgi:hypothetical protein
MGRNKVATLQKHAVRSVHKYDGNKWNNVSTQTNHVRENVLDDLDSTGKALESFEVLTQQHIIAILFQILHKTRGEMKIHDSMKGERMRTFSWSRTTPSM